MVGKGEQKEELMVAAGSAAADVFIMKIHC